MAQKRIFFLVILIAFVAIAGGVVYLKFFKKPTGESPRAPSGEKTIEEILGSLTAPSGEEKLEVSSKTIRSLTAPEKGAVSQDIIKNLTSPK